MTMRKLPALLIACFSVAAGHTTVARPAWAQVPAAPALAPDTSWVSRSAIYEVFVQDFSSTGDFRGVINGLDRIQAAGADVVWLMPIHPLGILNRKEPLGSPYAVHDYRAINPVYGTAADFRALVRVVHARGMKLILDWVPDHTAWDHVWVRRHPDFYVRNERGELVVPRDPQGRPTDWTDVVQLDYRNPALRRAMIGEMRYWLEQFDIDGFRVDVAGFVPDVFWREAVPALRAAARRPILLLAEWGDPAMHRLGFDLTYGWDAYNRLKAVWRGAPADTFIRSELPDLRAMPPGGMRMRFTTNHDETAWDTVPVTLFRGAAGARAAFTAIALLPGRPLLYNGQEVESPRRLGLFAREPVAWNQPNADSARAFYRRVMDLARTEPALIGGDLRAIETSAPRDLIAYGRGDVVVLVNARPRAVRAAVVGVSVDGARDLLSSQVQRGDTVALPPYSAMVLKMAVLPGQAGAPSPRDSAARCCTATIRVRVPEGTGTVYLAGSLPELGPWRPDGRAMAGDGLERTAHITAPAGTQFEYKFTLGSWNREALSAAGTVPPNNRLVIGSDTEVVHEITAFKLDPRDYIADWRGSGVLGRLVYWTDVRSAFLSEARHVEIWLPPAYDSSRSTRYPVLYMSDGQNLFDPRIANTGVDWGVDEAVVRLASRGVMPPIIVIGVWSTSRRGPEYSPWHDAPNYARFLIEELMPRVNAQFRTLRGPRNTAVMGSSMGGLLSFYLVTHHPDVFSACGCISTHFPLSERQVTQVFPGLVTTTNPDTTPYIVGDIAAGFRVPRGTRYWFDFGTLGIDSAYGPTHEVVRAWLLRQGLVEGRDFVIRRYEGATHNEAAWRARLDDSLTFLFGRRR